jgi:hypothetical protein
VGLLRKMTVSVAAAGALVVGGAVPAQAQNQAGNSLVNIQISDVAVQVPIAVALNLCDVNVNVLATQVETDPGPDCTADADSAADVGNGGGGNGGGNQAGDSLVNLQIDDLFVQVPVAVAANICDVSVNVVAQQVEPGEQTTCDALADAEANA